MRNAKRIRKILHCKKAAPFPTPMVNFDVEKGTIGWSVVAINLRKCSE
jgi:hypothetical protein